MSSRSKSGHQVVLPPLDFCAMAIEAGCGFVARSFSGDAKQLVPLLRAALQHRGTAVVDIISPCITFNNHDGSTKSFAYVKEQDLVLQEIGFFSAQEEINVDYQEGKTQQIDFPDGSHLILKKLQANGHDVGNAGQALEPLHQAKQTKEILTGLLYVDETRSSFVESLNLTSQPLNSLQECDLKPTEAQIAQILKSYQ